jgi:hypothetical protein
MTDAETVAIWLLNEGTGKKITDYSGRGHEGDILGGFKWVDGKFGKGLYLDSSGYIEIPHHEDFNFDKKMTIMVWAKLDDITPQEWGGMPRKENEYVLAPHKLGNKMEMTMWININGTWLGGQIPDPGIGPQLNFGEWHHYATTYDGDICRVYVDGKEIGNKKVGGAVNKTDAILRISNDCCGGRFMKGTLDEMVMAKDVFDVVMIQDYMKKGVEMYLSVGSAGKLSTTWGRLKKKG